MAFHITNCYSLPNLGAESSFGMLWILLAEGEFS